MKKILRIIVSILLLLSTILLTGCEKKKELIINEDLKNVIDEVRDSFLVPSPCNVDDDILSELLKISPESLVGYYGFISLDDGRIDKLIYIEAQEGYTKKTIKKLEDYISECSIAYKDTPFSELIENSVVLDYNNYVFLIMTARKDNDIKADINNISNTLLNELR